MDTLSGRNQRPVQQRTVAHPAQPQQQAAAPQQSTQYRQPRHEAPKKSLWKKLLPIVLGVLVVGALGFAVWSTVFGANSLIDGGKYQAVFLTNGQVYFGKLKKIDNNYYTLTDIYYLQASSTGAENAENPQDTAQSNSDVQIVKLGTEIHGPEDKMVIGSEQVLFFENLTKEGKVSQAIVQYKTTKK